MRIYQILSLLFTATSLHSLQFEINYLADPFSPRWTSQTETSHTPIKSVVFDFGGVLVKPDEDMLIAFLADFFDVEAYQIRELKVKELQWMRVNDTEFLFWENYGKERGKSLPLNWREEYSAVKLASVKELPLIPELLEDMQKEGHALEILSNFEPWMESLLDRFRYRDKFNHLYLSYQTKKEKPSADAYEAVLNDLNLQGKDIIFIDDQLKNVQAAQKLGIDAIHFISTVQLREELVKRKLLSR
jgi:HAD superfamily hydrolase (TIGR01509 family)